jgi:hypothetical protein
LLLAVEVAAVQTMPVAVVLVVFVLIQVLL